MKSLNSAYLRVSTETKEQFEAACALNRPELVSLDASAAVPEEWSRLAERAHKGTGGIGKAAAFRFPQIWREKAEQFFQSSGERLLESGFDAFYVRNLEEALWLREHGTEGSRIILEDSVYCFNQYTLRSLELLTGLRDFAAACSPELSFRELKELLKAEREGTAAHARELTVYGRVPLMVTAQCIRKTSIGCDRRPSVLFLKDRTGAFLPVRNSCRFCLNTVYNAVPTVLYDLTEELDQLSPDFIRYDFTTESAKEMREILGGKVPENYTRGHFRKGVL